MNPDDIDPTILLQNTMPQEDFCGLNANEMHLLLYSPYSIRSPIKLNEGIEPVAFDMIPFFRLTEEFLKILQRDKAMKLTTKGALPKKVVVELYSHRFILDQGIEAGIHKLSREADSLAISNTVDIAHMAGLMKKQYGRYYLTKEGVKLLLPQNRSELLKRVLWAFTERFPWDNNDGYPEEVGQMGWAYSLYLIHKFGDLERNASFYAEAYQKAFPRLMEALWRPTPSYTSPQVQFVDCYAIRTFKRFMEWFGLVKINQINIFRDPSLGTVMKTELVNRLFIFAE